MAKYGVNKISTINFNQNLSGIPNSNPSALNDLSLPNTDLSNKTLKFVRSNLSIEVVNHSIRIFLYARAIINEQFKNWDPIDEEVLFVTSLLHYIGFKDIKHSKLSFQLDSAIISREFIFRETGDKDYADAVGEAISRQGYINTNTGFITQLGLILQITVVLDNFGSSSVSKYVNAKTLDSVETSYPAHGWRGHLAAIIDEENEYKPWGLTSTLGKGLRENILNTSLYP
ncbi:hypothetical protein WICMUC_001705 [Wickerhamomyces mucosus]|uniref:HD domain-containing protein n=1 Tax=Wickerhamomyces mucosus TaxID=1378264 RepID=A0A9P8PT06_9ASCO|nr:hypothetical protein WICMUC_001705 [Wickerhamomyces mucosus]